MKTTKLVLGTAQFGLDYGINNQTGRPAKKDIAHILDYAYQDSVVELDTADAYGDASEVLRDYLKHSKNKFSIMSKFSTDSKFSFQESFLISLERLGQEKLAGYYFHKFSDFLEFSQFDQVQSMKSEGLLNSLGVSLYTNEELKKVVSHPEVDVIQLPMNLLDRDEEKLELLKIAHKNGKKIYIRSVFLQGLFFKSPTDLKGKLQIMKPAIEQILGITKKYSISLQDLCLSYVLKKDYVDKVVVGVETIEQLKINLNSLKQVELLTKEIEAEIESINIPDINLLNPSKWS